MPLHLVSVPALREPTLTGKLRENFGEADFTKVWEGTFIVDARRSAVEIATLLGLTEAFGIVSTLDAYRGFLPLDLVQWINARIGP